MNSKSIWPLVVAGMLIGLMFAEGGSQWRSGAPLITPRLGATAVVYGGKIYVLGGKTVGGAILNTVECFDPAVGQWDDTCVPPFADARFDAVAIIWNDELYLLGGVNHENEITDEVEVYNFPQQSWREVEKMRRKRQGHVAYLVNGYICVMGGIRDGNIFAEEIEWYDGNEWWEASSDIIAPTAAPYAAARDNVVYMFGGSRVSGWTQESFKAGVDSSWNFLWEGLPALQTARGYGATAVLGDSIFLIGGDTFGGTTAEVEIFNLRTQQLEPGVPLPAPRLGMAAATLNGEIYVIGGSETRGGSPLATVEIFSPITAVPPPSHVPRDFVQLTGYPNPFNGTIRLEVTIPSRGQHQISIVDLQGRLIRRLYRGPLTSGKHTFFWDATGEDRRPVASGIYVAMVRGNSYIGIFKVVYVR